MAFIKRGDGKILSVIKSEDLSDEQKKVASDLLKEIDDSKDKKDKETKSN